MEDFTEVTTATLIQVPGRLCCVYMFMGAVSRKPAV